MHFEDVFEFIGDFGIYQFLLIFLVGTTAMIAGYQSVAMNVLGGKMDHWGKVQRLVNFTHKQQKYISSPYIKEQGKWRYDQCKQFNHNFSQYSEYQLFHWNRTLENLNGTKTSTSWVYDQSVFESTAVNKYDLVCDKAWLVPLCSSAYMAGKFAGAIISGLLSDRFGRKPTIVVFVVLSLLFGLLDAFAPDPISFIVIRFLTSTSVTATQLTGFVMFMEICGPKWRMAIGVANQIFYAVGSMLTALAGFSIRHFMKAQLAMILPMAIGLTYPLTIPESPRWLLTHGREKQAMDLVKKIAKINNRELPEKFEFDKEETDTEKNKGSIIDLFRNPVLRRRTPIIYLNWFTDSLMYYGLSLNISSLSGNIFLNAFLMAAVEIPANIICMFLMAKLGRRATICGSLVFGALTMFGTIPLITRDDLGKLRTALNLLGKAAVTISFSGIYVWTAEIYPTVIRHVGVGSASTVSRISGMAAPFIGAPLRKVWPPLPSVIFGTFAGVSGLLALFLPETKDSPMPETIEEAEQIGRQPYKKTLTGKVNYGLTVIPIDYISNGINESIPSKFKTSENGVTRI